MRTIVPIVFLLMAVSALAQTPATITPAKPVAPATPSATPSGLLNGPGAPPKSNTTVAAGLLLYPGWDRRVTGPARAQNRDMVDLRAVLEKYGKAEVDLALHPEVQVLPGVPYLSPLKTFEIALGKQFSGSLGLSSEFSIATEGFPKGMKFRKYDRASLHIGANTHVYVLIDGANRVVSVAFAGRGGQVILPPPPLPLVQLPGLLSRNDLIDKSEGSATAGVADYRSNYKFVVVYTVGKRNVTWYVPEPMISLILYCSQL